MYTYINGNNAAKIHGAEKNHILKKKIVAFVHASCFVFKSFARRGRKGGIEPSVTDLVFS